MAAQGGTENTSLAPQFEQRLAGEACQFEFFQAIRLLERLRPDRAPVGRHVQPSREIARFTVNPLLAFPASAIQQITVHPGGQARMMVNFMGLTGPLGVLPVYYSQFVLERARARDSTAAAFFDLFNHRAISLFYRAWEKYRFTIAYERGERDRFSHHLLDLIGMGTAHLQNRQPVHDDALIYYAGLVALHTRSVSALRGLLSDYFDVPVEIEQFVGAWYALATDHQCSFEHGESLSEQLGGGAVVGDEVWEQQYGLRIILGPLTLEQYLDFLPNGAAHEPLRALTRFFCGKEFDFEVQLILRREEVPGCELGAEGPSRPQLGWLSWAKTAPADRDPGDTILRF